MSSPYTVLARKYRPKTFKDVFGQSALVQTLENALKNNRLAHAFILTGVRGIGKTTTARLIARALNCLGSDGKGNTTIEPCGVCTSCLSIDQDRHVDVIEIDAASRTGVDDIREIIETIQYRPVSGRYKIYIIDEVHMLSKNAFNALLKTLEEPPLHVKFVFATTEIRKVPVTILSRCQRFDLRRLQAKELLEYFSLLLQKEKISFENEAVGLIAAAADGSVRDGLTLLDRAINLTDANITTEKTREMLGLGRSSDIAALLNLLFEGNIVAALSTIDKMYQEGVDPFSIAQDLLSLLNHLTLEKVKGASQKEEETMHAILEKGSIPLFTRAWQVLLKGLDEMKLAPSPFAALQMVCVRFVHLRDVSSLDLLKEKASTPQVKEIPSQKNVLGERASSQDRPPKDGLTSKASTPSPQYSEEGFKTTDPFSFIVAFHQFLEDAKEPILASQLELVVHPVELNDNTLTIRLKKEAPQAFSRTLQKHLEKWTNKKWEIVESPDEGMPTIKEHEEKKRLEKIEKASKEATVSSLLKAFPGAKIESVE